MLGVILACFLGWFVHPLLSALVLPLFLIYYLSVGTRHPWFWHAGLLPGLLGAIAVNAYWSFDHWWILVPFQLDAPRLAHRTFHTVWSPRLRGSPLDRAFGCAVFVVALIGVGLQNQTGQRAAARLFGLPAEQLDHLPHRSFSADDCRGFAAPARWLASSSA